MRDVCVSLVPTRRPLALANGRKAFFSPRNGCAWNACVYFQKLLNAERVSSGSRDRRTRTHLHTCEYDRWFIIIRDIISCHETRSRLWIPRSAVSRRILPNAYTRVLFVYRTISYYTFDPAVFQISMPVSGILTVLPVVYTYSIFGESRTVFPTREPCSIDQKFLSFLQSSWSSSSPYRLHQRRNSGHLLSACRLNTVHRK